MVVLIQPVAGLLRKRTLHKSRICPEPILYVVANRIAARRPRILDLPVPGMKAKVKYHIPLRGTKAWEYYYGFVAVGSSQRRVIQ